MKREKWRGKKKKLVAISGKHPHSDLAQQFGPQLPHLLSVGPGLCIAVGKMSQLEAGWAQHPSVQPSVPADPQGCRAARHVCGALDPLCMVCGTRAPPGTAARVPPMSVARV